MHEHMFDSKNYELTVGDEVECTYGGRHTFTATVEKIGSKNVHIREGDRSVVQYRRETQIRVDGTSGFFRTKAQIEERAARREANETLRELGVEFRNGRATDWSTEHMQALATFVTTLKEITPS